MATLEEQFAQAKRHIQAKEYGKARAILRQIKHPTARQWEKKLDALDVPEPDLIIEDTPVRRSSVWKRYRVVLLIVLVLVLVTVWAVMRMNFQSGYDAVQQALDERQIQIIETVNAGQ